MNMRLPIPAESAGLYQNHWTGSLERSVLIGQICGKRREYVCTREPGHDGLHAAHHSANPDSGLCDLWMEIDPDLELDSGL